MDDGRTRDDVAWLEDRWRCIRRGWDEAVDDDDENENDYDDNDNDNNDDPQTKSARVINIKLVVVRCVKMTCYNNVSSSIVHIIIRSDLWQIKDRRRTISLLARFLSIK